MKTSMNVTIKISMALLLLSLSLAGCGGTPAPEVVTPAEVASEATEIVQPTATSMPPTDTPIPPTDTPIPPTDTPIPPTDTPVPPTATPLPVDTPTPAGPSAEEHYGQGMVYFDQEKYDLAIAEFREAARLEPDSAWPYLYWGASYYLTGTASNEEVIALLEKFLQLAPADAEERDEVVALLEEIRAGAAPDMTGSPVTPLGQPIEMPPGKGVVVITNYVGGPVIFDLAGQSYEIPGKDTTPEGGEVVIPLSPGHYTAIAHKVDGSAAGNVEFDIETGDVLEWPLYE